MRILHVVPTYLPATRYGGPIFAVHGLCCALARLGHHVEVLTTNIDGSGNSPVPLQTPVLVDGVHVRYFSSPILRRIYWAPTLANHLRRHVDDFNIVHLHSVFLWPTWAAARAASWAKIPYLISPRGMLVKDLIEHRSRCIKLAWIQLIEKRNLREAAAIHVTSMLEKEELQRFAWEMPQIYMIPNGITKIESFADNHISADVKAIMSPEPLVLFLGRISWKKGLDLLLNAFARTTIGRLAIIGPDDEGLSPRLREMARDLRIVDRVQILPRMVLGADKEFVFNLAKIFVLPSHSENFGNSVLEAMQRGVPVVVTPGVGAADIVSNSKGGLVEQRTPEAFGAAICRLLAEPGLAASMGAAGRYFVSKNYSWDGIAPTVLQLYETLCGRRSIGGFRMNP